MSENFEFAFGQRFITEEEKAEVSRAIEKALENWDINSYNEFDETYSDEVFVKGKTYRFDVDAKYRELDENGEDFEMQFERFVAVTRVQ